MNIFERFVNYLDYSGDVTPESFGWYHLMFVVIILLITVLLCVFAKDASLKFYKTTVLVWYIIIVLLEIGKQLIMSFNYDGSSVTWEYDWSYFPFQFCSAPLYVYPFLIFLKEGKLKDAFISFASFFVLVGGLIVFIYPNDVFTSRPFIDIQTMLHHGSQIIIGVYSMVYYRKKIDFKFFLRGLPVFAIFCAIAIGMNELAQVISPGIKFSMFYVSRAVPNHLPILSDIYKALDASNSIIGFIGFAVAYIIGFTIMALIIFGIFSGIMKLNKLTKKSH